MISRTFPRRALHGSLLDCHFLSCLLTGNSHCTLRRPIPIPKLVTMDPVVSWQLESPRNLASREGGSGNKAARVVARPQPLAETSASEGSWVVDVGNEHILCVSRKSREESGSLVLVHTG